MTNEEPMEITESFRFDPLRARTIAHDAIDHAPEPLRSQLRWHAEEHGVDIVPLRDRPGWLAFLVNEVQVASCPAQTIAAVDGVQDAYVAPDGTVRENVYDPALIEAVNEAIFGP